MGAALRIAARRWPDQDTVVLPHQNVRLSWAELADRAEALAAGLMALGLRPGDWVGVWAPNCIEWTLTQFGTALAGLIQVNINPAHQLDEAVYTLWTAGVRAPVCANRFKITD